MRFKTGVNIQGIRPELLLALFVADEVYKEFGVKEGVTVTSVMDGKHSEASLHYEGLAADLRISPTLRADDWELVAGALHARLHPVGFDVVIETSQPHIHLEYDPK